LIEVIWRGLTGSSPAATTLPRSDDAVRKKITALLDRGPQLIFFDNIDSWRTLAGSSLAAALTASIWADRRLGATEMIDLPVRCAWVATANNPSASHEISRRVVPIRLDAGSAKPWLRTDFRHENLRQWTADNRERLLHAILVIIQNWCAAGMPRGKGSLGSYEDWAGVMNGILDITHVPGFLGNLSTFYHATDDESREWQTFIAVWWERYREQDVSATQLVELCNDQDVLLNCLGKGHFNSQRIRLGKAMRTRMGRPTEGFTVEAFECKSRKANRYRLRANPGSPGGMTHTEPSPGSPGSAPGGDASTSRTENSGTTTDTGQSRVVRVVEDELGVGGIPPDRTCGGRVVVKGGAHYPDYPDPVGSSGQTVVFGPGCARSATRKHPGDYPDPVFHTSAEGLLEVASSLTTATESGEPIALDVETTGLDPIEHRPRLLQLGFPDGVVHVIDLFSVPDIGPLGDALREATVIGHNLHFDLRFLSHHLGFVPTSVRDTMLASILLAKGVPPEVPVLLGASRKVVPGPHSLAGCCARLLSVSMDKEQQQSDWSGSLNDGQIAYAARDVAVLHPLWRVMSESLNREGLAKVAGLENDLVPIMSGVELAGVKVLRSLWGDICQEQIVRASRSKAEAESLLSGVNVNSSVQVKRALSKHLGLELPNVKKETLTAYQGDAVVDALLRYRGVANFGIGKRITTALDQSQDGRVRGSWKQLSAPTGRMSCSSPALLSFPRSRGCRAAVTPADGTMFIVADYSTIEVRIAAQIAGDEFLIDLFQQGEDVHCVTAAAMLGKEPHDVVSEERTLAKPVNFGLLYGMMPLNLVPFARSEYDLILSKKQANGFATAFFDRYRGVRRWHDRIWGLVKRKSGVIEARTLSGRARLFERPKSRRGSKNWYSDLRSTWRACLNTPVQGTGADGMKRALVLLAPRLEALGARVVLVVHDELVVEAPIEVSDEVNRVVRSGMIEGMAHYITDVPIEVESRISSSWAAG